MATAAIAQCRLGGAVGIGLIAEDFSDANAVR